MPSTPMDGTTSMLLTIAQGFEQMQNNMHAQVMAQTQAMQGMFQSMQNFQSTFNQGQASAPAPAPTFIQSPAPSGDPRSSTKIKEPREFNGRAEEVILYIEECEKVFKFNSPDFRTPDRKVLYASSYLKDGNPRNWYSGLVQAKSPALSTWEGYVASLKLHFLTLDLASEAYDKLRNLKQTGSAAAHIARFNELAQFVEMSPTNRLTLLEESFKLELRAALIHINWAQPYDKLTEEIIRIDNKMHRLHKSEKKKSPPTNTFKPSPQIIYQPIAAAPALPAGEPMQIDATKTKPKFKGPLSQAEKDRRREKGLCGYCGLHPYKSQDGTVQPCPNKSEAAKRYDAQRSASSSRSGSGKA